MYSSSELLLLYRKVPFRVILMEITGWHLQINILSLAEFSTLGLVLLFFFFFSSSFIFIYTHKGIHIETDWRNDSFRRLSCCTHCVLMNSCALPSQLVSTVQVELKTGEETEGCISGIRKFLHLCQRKKSIYHFYQSLDEWERKRIEWSMWKIIKKRGQGVSAWTQSSKMTMRNVVNGYREMVRHEGLGHP